MPTLLSRPNSPGEHLHSRLPLQHARVVRADRHDRLPDLLHEEVVQHQEDRRRVSTATTARTFTQQQRSLSVVQQQQGEAKVRTPGGWGDDVHDNHGDVTQTLVSSVALLFLLN